MIKPIFSIFYKYKLEFFILFLPLFVVNIYGSMIEVPSLNASRLITLISLIFMFLYNFYAIYIIYAETQNQPISLKESFKMGSVVFWEIAIRHFVAICISFLLLMLVYLLIFIPLPLYGWKPTQKHIIISIFALVMIFFPYSLIMLVSFIIDKKTLFSTMKLALKGFQKLIIPFAIFFTISSLTLKLLTKEGFAFIPKFIKIFISIGVSYFYMGFVIITAVLIYMSFREKNRDKIENMKSF